MDWLGWASCMVSKYHRNAVTAKAQLRSPRRSPYTLVVFGKSLSGRGREGGGEREGRTLRMKEGSVAGKRIKEKEKCRSRLRSDESVTPSERTWSQAAMILESSCIPGRRQPCWTTLHLVPPYRILFCLISMYGLRMINVTFWHVVVT